MQNAVLEAIAARRSVRGYKPEQIAESELQTLITAVQQAPSARNMQPWHFTVVQNKALIDRINESVRASLLQNSEGAQHDAFADPSYSVFYHAPTVIFLSTDMRGEKLYARHDCGCASQTLSLAALSMGLGSVILGMPRDAFIGPDGDEYRRLLGFPEGYDFMVAVAIGYPTVTKEAHPILPDRVCVIR